VPVVHRGLATSFTVVTGHSGHAVDRDTNWEALAAAGGTIVVLMGVAHRAAIAERLIGGGLDPATPVAAVRWGTRPEQASVRCRLDELGAVTLEPPATIVIGLVAGLDLGWYEARPLFGRRVVVTRARAQASELSRRLEELGARVVEIPAIRIEEPGDGGEALEKAAASLSGYGWVVFTSANAVTALLDRVPDLRALGGVSIAAVGSATAAALADRGLVPDVVPADDRRQAEGLVEAFPAPAGSGRVLFPRASGGREALLDGLRAAGWEVDLVEAYRTVPVEIDEGACREAAAADAICFTSSSTVTSFVDGGGIAACPPVVACIGPTTAATARQAGLVVSAVAAEASVDGLVEALVGCFRRS
jgi:uroporphyrinogen III methyltransferase/synthase